MTVRCWGDPMQAAFGFPPTLTTSYCASPNILQKFALLVTPGGFVGSSFSLSHNSQGEYRKLVIITTAHAKPRERQST